MSLNSRTQFHIALTATLLCGCARQSYPMNGYRAGELPERHRDAVELIFGERAPGCEHTEIAVVMYDWMKDGILTSETIALNGLRKEAARLGADGVYKIELVQGGTVVQGVGTGNTTFTGPTASSTGVFAASAVKETGARGIAYSCSTELASR